MLTVKDMLEEPEDWWKGKLFTGRLIAKDSSTGKEVFDTYKKGSEYVKKFFPCVITGMYCGLKFNGGSKYETVLNIYLKGDEVHECKRQNS